MSKPIKQRPSLADIDWSTGGNQLVPPAGPKLRLTNMTPQLIQLTIDGNIVPIPGHGSITFDGHDVARLGHDVAVKVRQKFIRTSRE